MEKELHQAARSDAEILRDPDKKHLRFNEIVSAALDFYPENPREGVRELVAACDRAAPDLYVKAWPMWRSLRARYGWML